MFPTEDDLPAEAIVLFLILLFLLAELQQWLWQKTGGRPMVLVEHAFVDSISGKSVWYAVDKLDRCWMTEGSWSSFRVSTAWRPRWLAP